MKPKQAFILFAVAAVLVALILGNEYVLKPRKQAKKEEASLFFPGLDLSRVNGIEIIPGNTAEKATVLVSGGDTVWKVESQGGFPADPDAVKNLLESLKDLKRGTLSSESKTSHERLEVDEKHGTRLKLKSGGQVLADLIIGMQGKNWGTYFVRLADDEKVYLVYEDMKNLIDGNAGEWRTKKIFNEEAGQVEEITLTVTPGATAEPASASAADKDKSRPKAEQTPAAQMPEITILRRNRSADSWELVLPGGSVETLDKNKVESLARSLCTLSAVEFADTVSPEKAALDPPLRQAEFKLSDGRTLSLLVGQSDLSKFYVKRTDQEMIYRVYRYNIDNIFRKKSDLQSSSKDEDDFSSLLPPPPVPSTETPGETAPGGTPSNTPAGPTGESPAELPASTAEPSSPASPGSTPAEGVSVEKQ